MLITTCMTIGYREATTLYILQCSNKALLCISIRIFPCYCGNHLDFQNCFSIPLHLPQQSERTRRPWEASSAYFKALAHRRISEAVRVEVIESWEASAALAIAAIGPEFGAKLHITMCEF